MNYNNTGKMDGLRLLQSILLPESFACTVASEIHCTQRYIE